ncbi:MAG: rRNA pseudouridine synthase [Anaerolineales bacterium]|nr:rRNA pseudouridine synthase [Anaerolineales bacterium]
MEERLQKLLAQAGHGSRRACEDFITQGRVRVNGQLAVLGQKADPARDTITLDGEPLARERLTYLLVHKPRGVVSSLEAQGDRQTVVDLVPSTPRLYPVGRLDLDSEGLILLTNDGDLANRLTHPRYGVEKEYRVLVKGEPDAERLAAWRRGVVLEDRETGQRFRTRPAEVRRDEVTRAGTWLSVVMREGRKHEIREIGSALGLPVERLIRVRLASLNLGELRAGEWRPLTNVEVRALQGAAKPGDADKPRRPARPSGGSAAPARNKSRAAPEAAQPAPRQSRPAGGRPAAGRPAGRPTAGRRPKSKSGR